MNETSQKPDNEKRVNCFKCEYYVNTWIPKYPRACKFFGFKSAGIPSDVVYRSTGEHCNVFTEKVKTE